MGERVGQKDIGLVYQLNALVEEDNGEIDHSNLPKIYIKSRTVVIIAAVIALIVIAAIIISSVV